MKNQLYLTGYRGTGKSSVARRLAVLLDLPTIDLDRRIEADAGRSIREIFKTAGEIEFRRLETIALTQTSAGPVAVIALGGGAILAESNRQQIAQTGCCVWLTASAETLAARIASDAASGENRPPLTNLPAIDEVKSVLAARHDLYAAVADKTVTTEDRSIQEIADQIAAWYRSL